jgi:hypothetical protein
MTRSISGNKCKSFDSVKNSSSLENIISKKLNKNKPNYICVHDIVKLMICLTSFSRSPPLLKLRNECKLHFDSVGVQTLAE